MLTVGKYYVVRRGPIDRRTPVEILAGPFDDGDQAFGFSLEYVGETLVGRAVQSDRHADGVALWIAERNN